MWRDLLFAWRTLRNRRGFTVVATLTLALGVGASTAMFSVIDATLLRPLPFRSADRLTMVQGVFGPEQQVRGSSYPEAMDWRAGARAFSGMSVYDPISLSLSGDAEAEQVPAEVVSANFFDLLGVTPRLGRALQSGDDVAGGPRTLVLSYALWRRRYSTDPAVIGRTITVQGVPLTVVGVMPENFGGISFQAEVWTTHAALQPDVLEDRGSRWLGVLGQLAPGRTLPDAAASLQTITRELERRFPDTNTQRSAIVTPLRDSYLGSTEQLLIVLFGAVVLLLLIACVNVTSLQLVRAAGRRHEMSLRHALGATRARLVRQLLAEGLVLSGMGSLIGLFAAYWGIQLFLPLIPNGVLPPYATVSIDLTAGIFALLVALACGTTSALLPALRASGRDLGSDLRSRGVAGYGARGRIGPQQVLVASEIALAFLVLVCAGLMLRSFQRQLRVDPGFAADGVLVARVSLPQTAYNPERRAVFVEQLLERARTVPGVSAAAVASDVPLRGNSNAGSMQRIEHPDERIRYYRHWVTPQYFTALGIEILHGRGFSATDRAGAERVVIVGETAARRLWPDRQAVGQRMRLGVSAAAPVATVVGVAADARHRSLTVSLADPTDDPDFYLPYAQVSIAEFEIVLRTTAESQTVVPLLRRALRELDAGVPLHTIDTLDRALAAATAQARFASFLLSLFGVLALTLAAVGVYGVMTYYVNTTALEIAIRMAVGAEPGTVRSLILRRGGVLIGAGTLVGAMAALAVTSVLRVLLFGVQSRDPVTFAAVALVLGGIAVVANYIPAWRATRVDPQLALKSSA